MNFPFWVTYGKLFLKFLLESVHAPVLDQLNPSPSEISEKLNRGCYRSEVQLKSDVMKLQNEVLKRMGDSMAGR